MEYNLLIACLNKYIPVAPSDIEEIREVFELRTYTKNSILIDFDEKANGIFFIAQGITRTWNIDYKGNEQTIHLNGPGEFVTSVNSFFSQVPASEQLITVTDCNLLYISREKLLSFSEPSSKWVVFMNKLYIQILIEKEQRIVELLSLSASERYVNLNCTKSYLIGQVPVQYIASYIGIRPESLSRIRRTIF